MLSHLWSEEEKGRNQTMEAKTASENEVVYTTVTSPPVFDEIRMKPEEKEAVETTTTYTQVGFGVRLLREELAEATVGGLGVVYSNSNSGRDTKEYNRNNFERGGSGGSRSGGGPGVFLGGVGKSSGGLFGHKGGETFGGQRGSVGYLFGDEGDGDITSVQRRNGEFATAYVGGGSGRSSREHNGEFTCVKMGKWTDGLEGESKGADGGCGTGSGGGPRVTAGWEETRKKGGETSGVGFGYGGGPSGDVGGDISGGDEYDGGRLRGNTRGRMGSGGRGDERGFGSSVGGCPSAAGGNGGDESECGPRHSTDRSGGGPDGSVRWISKGRGFVKGGSNMSGSG